MVRRAPGFPAVPSCIGVWTSNSNGPTWQIEEGVPKVVRIDPDGAPSPEESGLFPVEAQSFEVPLVAREVAPFR